MSFDIYLYRSKIGTPDFNEASSVTMEDDDSEFQDLDSEATKRQAEIAAALIKLNPRLEVFDLDYDAIAAFQNISASEAKSSFDYIELNTPEGDLATQITVFKNYVAITIPYWYKDKQAEEVFEIVDRYAKAVFEVAGYFAFDPQTGDAFNPVEKKISSSQLYEGTSKMVRNMPVENQQISKKPWWKFW